MISCGVVPCGCAVFKGPAPASHSVPASRAAGDKKKTAIIMVHRPVLEKVMDFLNKTLSGRISRANGCNQARQLHAGLKPKKALHWRAFPEETKMRRFKLLFISLVLILPIGGAFVQLSAQPAAKKPFTFEDMMLLKRIGGPTVSPDGKWVLFSAVEVDLRENKRTSHLWVVPIGGGTARQMP